MVKFDGTLAYPLMCEPSGVQNLQYKILGPATWCYLPVATAASGKNKSSSIRTLHRVS
jgi:hypothetical protein